MMPELTVIVPTYNRLQRLQQVLAGLAEQTYPAERFAVVVVSDGSSDGTNEYLTSLTMPFALQAIVQENQGVATARNRGLEEAQAPLVLFLDDDVVPAPTLLAEHLSTHEEEGAGVVVLGPMLTPADHALLPWVSWEQEMLYKQYEAMIRGEWSATARQFYTGNTSLARRYLLAAGGFDPAFHRAEDVELAYRLADMNLRFVFNPDAVGLHYAVRSYHSWLQTPYLYGRNDVIFTQEKEQAWLLPKIFSEFNGRHPLVRGLTHLCLDQPALSKVCIGLLHGIGSAAYRLGSERVSRLAYSGIFNLRHYQGIADGLGGRGHFLRGVAAAQDAGPGQESGKPVYTRDERRKNAS